MKLMSRNFSTKEKVLLILLAVMLLGLIYYKLVYSRLHTAVVNAQSEVNEAVIEQVKKFSSGSLQSELEVAQMRLARIKKMEREMDGYKSTGMIAKMGSYNNSKPETAFLNTVLSGVNDYSISFEEVTRDGDQIRRNFTLQYKTSSYAEAEKIMKDLTSGEYRCLISDVNCSVDSGGVVTVSLIGTFYETMVGGTPDSALPKDEAETDNTVKLEDFE